MTENNQQPIIIKRIKKGGHGHHGGAWKVAMADFMTAMMAFFMVMWLVGQKPEVREAVAGYFQDPGNFNKQGQAGVLKGSSSVIPTENPPLNLKQDRDSDPESKNKEDKIKLTLTAKKIMEELKKQEAFKDLQKNITINMTSEGLRIILNESEDSPAFFEPGSAKLLQKSAIILLTIASELGKVDNLLVIEGHTDASFGGSKKYSNWELSTDRANSARQLMEVSGLRKDQVREVRGFADRFPMFADNPNDHRNRRITLVLLYKSKARSYDQLAIETDIF